MEQSLLKDKVVLVTGSTTGIGEAVARRCVAEGARVMIHGRDRERAEQVVADLGGAAAFHIADLSDPQSAGSLVNAAIERFGRLDGLVNNAALTTRCNLENVDVETFDRIIAVNLRMPMLLIKEALPHFRRQGGGSVVNIGSVNAFCGEPNLLVYSMSKGGLMTMTRNLADRYGTERLRINQINVGWTLTENERKLKESEGLPPGWEKELPVSYAPFGRIFEPVEVARHVVFWLSDVSGPATGTVYEIEQHPMLGRNPNKEM